MSSKLNFSFVRNVTLIHLPLCISKMKILKKRYDDFRPIIDDFRPIIEADKLGGESSES